jgi:uncharacterized protein DUF6491
MKTLSAILVAAALASGCASSSGLSKSEELLNRYEPYVGEPVSSFTAFRQESWQPISRTQLVLWTSINDAYLLTVANNCPNMMFTNAVQVTSTASGISTLDHVIVKGDRCPITQIQPIDVRRMRDDKNAREAEAAARTT